ncbi:MAG: GGDEF domain-containing protein [Candidatus Thiodiazotropha sp.]
MMDVDHFKQYNDNYGHGAGDDCLRRVAQALDSVVQRSADLVARYGGEEFAAILPVTDAEDGRQVGERFRRAVDALSLEHKYSATTGGVTISVGVATLIPDLRGEPTALLEEADHMLYVAKDKGPNCVVGNGRTAKTDKAGTEKQFFQEIAKFMCGLPQGEARDLSSIS